MKRPLRITHINTHDKAGGAAKSSWRLASAQRTRGHSAIQLVGAKVTDCAHSHQFAVQRPPGLAAACEAAGELFYEFQGSHALAFHPIINASDVVHLHNLHGSFFNPFSLSALSHRRPVVWTLRDMQSITGHCAHSFDCTRWEHGCGSCPGLNIEPALRIDSTSRLWRDKAVIYEHSYLNLVAPSQWLKSKVERSILRNHPVHLIYNGVETSVFRPFDKQRARERFGIPAGCAVIGAVAHGGALANQWKGGEYTLRVIEDLSKDRKDFIFVNVGSDTASFDGRIMNVPAITEEADLAELYSCFDMFLYTPRADTCPLVVIEALACGVPVFAFSTGGVPELVRHAETGVIVPFGDTAMLGSAVRTALDSPAMLLPLSARAREDAVSRLEHSITAQKYEGLYYQLCDPSLYATRAVRLFTPGEVPSTVRTPGFQDAEGSKLAPFWVEPEWIARQSGETLPVQPQRAQDPSPPRIKTIRLSNEDILGRVEPALASGRLQDACFMLNEILKTEADSFLANLLLGALLLRKGGGYESRQFLDRAARLDGMNVSAVDLALEARKAYPDVSIVVATKDRASLLDSMLSSLHHAAGNLAYEVIAIVAPSQDHTLEVLERHRVDTIIPEEKTLGPGKHTWAQLYNVGFKAARGCWAMYASDDITFSPLSLATGVSLLNAQAPNVGGGIFFYRNLAGETDWKEYGIDYTFGGKLLMNYGLLRLSAINAVGGLDEHYRFYAADGDLCFRIYDRGLSLLPLPGCFVDHHNVLDIRRRKAETEAELDFERYRALWSKYGADVHELESRRLLWRDLACQTLAHGVPVRNAQNNHAPSPIVSGVPEHLCRTPND